MVEYTISTNAVFSALSDATRRDILRRVSLKEQSIGELAEAHKKLSFAAVAKHVSVLEEAYLVMKRKEGRYQIISVNPKTINRAVDVLQEYKTLWNRRFDKLDALLK